MNIFLSYSSKNRPAVKALVADLASLGHEVWFDQELAGGQVWWDTILDHIRTCDLFILALTGHAMKSGPCKLEYTYAYELGKPILPVLLSDDVTISLLPVILQERQFVNYINQDKAALLALNNAFQGITPAPTLPDPLPTPPPIPISPLAELQDEVEQRSLSYEQQVALFHRIKDYVEDPDHHEAALELLKQLEQHPSLLAAVFKEINTYLSTATPGRAPQPASKADTDADAVHGVAVDDTPPPTGPPLSGEVAQLSIRRPQELYALLRAYGIHMDGQKIGDVRNNQTVTIMIPAGQHTLYIQLDWVKSDPLMVDLQPGETAYLVATGQVTKLGFGTKLTLTWDQ
jgi:hypothetical protein